MDADAGRCETTWPIGGGTMGALIRAHHWSHTPLGPIATWPQSLRTAVDLLLRSPVPIVLLWGEDGVMLYNDAYSGVAGGRHPQLLGSKVREGWPEIADFNDNVMKVGLSGGTLSYKDQELTLHRNGRPEPVWMNLDYSPVLDESGVPAGVIAIVVETTERVLAGRQVNAERERLAGMFQQAPGFMCMLRGPDHVYELVNEALDRLTGNRPLLGRSVREAQPEVEGQGFHELLDRVYATGEAFTAHRAPLRTPSGPNGAMEERFLDFVLQPVFDAGGAVTGIFVEGADVTDQARAEAALREGEERFRLMADAVPAIVWITDAEGRVEFFNWQWSDYTGVPYEPTTVTEVIASFIHPDEAALTAERFEEARRTGGTYLVEHRLRSKDGDYRWFLVRGEPYRDPRSGEVVRWFGASTDIHDRKHAEAELRAARDTAEEANRSKSRFLAAASHDLRQPMQSLLLFLDVLKPHVAPKGQDALKHLGRGLDALRDLLDSLLDISRLDAGIVQPAIEDFAVGQVVEQIGSAYAPVAAAKGLNLHVTNCEAAVRSDRTLLGRMVRNLIENALRYTDQGHITIACREEENSLRIEVADTGIGIPPEHLERIWEEFHQVGNPERDRNRGLGLGLAIVQRLSSLLEHPVEVRSILGGGSVFSIEVPLGRAEPRQAPVSATEVAGNGRFAVLVDDDAIVLLGLKATFEAWGYEVLAAGSADRALAALEVIGQRPDIVVADYRLREGRNGTEAILRVREAYGASIPGIILTGETGAEAQRDAAEHTLGIIHKPVTPRQLSMALENQMKVVDAAR